MGGTGRTILRDIGWTAEKRPADISTDLTNRQIAAGPRRRASTSPSPAKYLRSLENMTVAGDHPYGGRGILRDGEVVCFVRVKRIDGVTVEISGMYAPVRGGGSFAMCLLAGLADILNVRLHLVAASSVPDRKDTAALVLWYKTFGFTPVDPDKEMVEMFRLPVSVSGVSVAKQTVGVPLSTSFAGCLLVEA